MHAERVPGDAGAQHVERAEVLQFLVPGCLVIDLHGRQHEPGEVVLQPGVGGADRDAELLEHLVAIGRANHGRETGVFQHLPDLRGVVGQRTSDLDTGASKDAVDGVVHRIGVIAQAVRFRWLHDARGHCRTVATHGSDGIHEYSGAGALIHPALLPGTELQVELSDRRPQMVIDPREQLLLAGIRHVAAVQAIDGLENLGVACLRDLLAQREEQRGVDGLIVLFGEPLHGLDQILRDVVQADLRGQRGTDGADDGRLVDLQYATGLQGLQPRAVVRNRRQDAVEGHRRCGLDIRRGGPP